MEKSRRGRIARYRYCLLPLAGTVFIIWYIRSAFYDVVYSDYIRLVNSYLPDVWNPAKFLVPDVLTRVPLTYLGRIVNTAFFHYSVTFDQMLGALGLGLLGVVLAVYCGDKNIGAGWALAVMAVVFSLGKWEMLTNGSGWVHFFAFAGFYYHYLVMDRVLCGRARPRDGRTIRWLPWLLILGVAGQYCAAYAAVLFLTYIFKMILERAEGKRRMREYLTYLAWSMFPFGCYLLSNAFAVEDHAGMQDIPLLTQLAETPLYFVRFFLKSLSSAAVGISYAESHFSTNLPYMVLGLAVAAAYAAALWFQYRFRLYEKTVLPLMLMVHGGINHVLVLLARWSFLREDYGMSSRYSLQFAAGVLGIVLTFALVQKAAGERKACENGADKTGAPGDEKRPAERSAADRENACGEKEVSAEEKVLVENKKPSAAGGVRLSACRCAAVLFTAVFVAGALIDTRQELQIAPYRKILCTERAQIALDFENRTDDELRENFEYRTSQPQSGQAVRNALTILKEQGWNVFYDAGRPAEAGAADIP